MENENIQNQDALLNPFNVVDRLSERLSQSMGVYIQKDGDQSPMFIKQEMDEMKIAVNQLVADGYMIMEETNNLSHYYLNGKGKAFLLRGGYKAERERENEKYELEIKQFQSVIETNKSVKQTNKLFWLTIVIAFLALLSQITMVWRDIRKDKENTLQLQIDSLNIQKEMLQDSLKNISAHQKDVKDSVQ